MLLSNIDPKARDVLRRLIALRSVEVVLGIVLLLERNALDPALRMTSVYGTAGGQPADLARVRLRRLRAVTV
jgi:hypothetical protein